MKKKVQLVNGEFMRLHYKPQPKIIQKAIDIANEYVTGEVQARKLSNGLFSVIDITRSERILIDKDKQLHLMSHEKYNDIINQR